MRLPCCSLVYCVILKVGSSHKEPITETFMNNAIHVGVTNRKPRTARKFPSTRMILFNTTFPLSFPKKVNVNINLYRSTYHSLKSRKPIHGVIVVIRSRFDSQLPTVPFSHSRCHTKVIIKVHAASLIQPSQALAQPSRSRTRSESGRSYCNSYRSTRGE